MNVSGQVQDPAALSTAKDPPELADWIRGLAGPQEMFDIFVEEKYLLPMSGIETWFPDVQFTALSL